MPLILVSIVVSGCSKTRGLHHRACFWIDMAFGGMSLCKYFCVLMGYIFLSEKHRHVVFVVICQKIIIYINISCDIIVLMYWAEKVRIEISVYKPAVGYWLLNRSIVHHMQNTVHIQTSAVGIKIHLICFMWLLSCGFHFKSSTPFSFGVLFCKKSDGWGNFNYLFSAGP